MPLRARIAAALLCAAVLFAGSSACYEPAAGNLGGGDPRGEDVALGY